MPASLTSSGESPRISIRLDAATFALLVAALLITNPKVTISEFVRNAVRRELAQTTEGKL